MLLIATSIAAAAVEYKRERYGVIIERSPFGEDPLLAQDAAKNAQDAKAAAESATAAKKMEKEMRLCFLLETDSGEIRAGFQNLKAQQGEPKSIMLIVGDSFKGMTLSRVDIAAASATLSLNGKPVTFELTKASAAPAAKKAPAQPQRRFGGGFSRQPALTAEPQLSSEEQAKKREEAREKLRRLRNRKPKESLNS